MGLNSVSGRRLQKAILMIGILVGLVPAILAQSTVATGCVTGVVTDPSGGTAVGVNVILTNMSTRQSFSFMTTTGGLYTSGPIVAGNYTVKLDVPGFASVQFPVTINVGTTASGNIRLRPNGDKKTNEAASVNFAEATVEGVIDSQAWENLPVNGRDFLDLAQLEPGIQIVDAARIDPTKSG
ncbi:MAG: carboxypeptidase-like regulatory domain-containing protein, partial [Terriglobales bacterium]